MKWNMFVFPRVSLRLRKHFCLCSWMNCTISIMEEKKNLLSTTLIARQLTPDCSRRPQVSSDRCLAFPVTARSVWLNPTWKRMKWLMERHKHLWWPSLDIKTNDFQAFCFWIMWKWKQTLSWNPWPVHASRSDQPYQQWIYMDLHTNEGWLATDLVGSRLETNLSWQVFPEQRPSTRPLLQVQENASLLWSTSDWKWKSTLRSSRPHLSFTFNLFNFGSHPNIYFLPPLLQNVDISHFAAPSINQSIYQSFGPSSISQINTISSTTDRTSFNHWL